MTDNINCHICDDKGEYIESCDSIYCPANCPGHERTCRCKE